MGPPTVTGKIMFCLRTLNSPVVYAPDCCEVTLRSIPVSVPLRFFLIKYFCSDIKNNKKYVEGRKMFYLTTHLTHFIYDYMASDKW